MPEKPTQNYVLVTGANGFLATNVIVELLSRGYAVKGVLRDLKSFGYPAHSNLELVQGDFTEEKFIEKAISGCDYIIHAAAITDQSLARYSDYHRVNVAAVENLITIAIREKVKRFVYIGSANAFGYGSKENPGDEQQPARKPFTSSFYAISKLRGQQAALAYSDKIDVVAVNPAFMLGPYDSKPGSGKIILLGYKRKIVFYPPGGKNFVHVQDVAKGVVSALEKGRNGEA
jgi:nucleoside-diphosphate-sugar epimerase